MPLSPYPWNARTFQPGRVSLGGLAELCEENYRLLRRLIPGVANLRERHQSLVQGVALHLEILEQTRYTTLLHLTYYFRHSCGERPDPDATLRAYHDAVQVEVLDLRQTVPSLALRQPCPLLEQKWRTNLFLSKWLVYCLAQGHRFHAMPAFSQRGRVAASLG